MKTKLYVRRDEILKTVFYSPYPAHEHDTRYTLIDTIEVEHINPDDVPANSALLKRLREEQNTLAARIEALENES